MGLLSFCRLATLPPPPRQAATGALKPWEVAIRAAAPQERPRLPEDRPEASAARWSPMPVKARAVRTTAQAARRPPEAGARREVRVLVRGVALGLSRRAAPL